MLSSANERFTIQQQQSYTPLNSLMEKEQNVCQDAQGQTKQVRLSPCNLALCVTDQEFFPEILKGEIFIVNQT